jgi:peptide/nickel transport system permease protein
MSTVSTPAAAVPPRLDTRPRPSRAAASVGPWARLARALPRRPPVLASGLFILLVVATALAAPALPLRSPSEQSVVRRLRPPTAENVLGTDRLGRDILSRVVWGAQVSMAVGVAVVAISGLTGTLVGLASGYFRGAASDLLVRGVDVLQAFPALILAMAIVTALGPGLANVVWGISLGFVPQFARVARAATLAVRERDYVEAARAAGASTRRVLLRHVLVNGIDPVIVLCTLLIPSAILTEAMLSFLGLGITEPTPTWGNMIDNGRLVLREAPWLAGFPSAAIVLTVIAFNLVGDAIRDALDPHITA